METLGFHRPQFSEAIFGHFFYPVHREIVVLLGLYLDFRKDLAWLPGWIQHHVDQFDHCKDEYLGSSKLTPKVPMLFQSNIFTGNDVLMLSLKEGGGHNSHCLFLSGEENSASSFTSSSRNVLQFSLHLSSNGVSQCTPSSLGVSEASQTFSEPGQVLPIRKFETCFTTKENTLPDVGLESGGEKTIPQHFSPRNRRNDPANSEKSTRHSGKKFSHRHLKDAEIKDAVELSISASEALVIHEIVASSPDYEETASTDALEVSLHMRKARSQWLEGTFDFSMGIDETDSLSDLNDFAMTAAFEDVGLVCLSDEQDLSDSSVSHVKETPIHVVKCDDISTQEKSETILDSEAKQPMDYPLEYLNNERKRKLFNHSDMILQQVEKTNHKVITKAFTRETSFLSESADIAPDENSIVQIREIYSLAESQSSVGGVEVLPDKSCDEVLLSQDVVKSSCLYLLDPLCSAVPCSFSIEETSIVEVQNHENLVTDLGSNIRPEIESEILYSCKVSNRSVEIDCEEEKTRHGVDNGVEGSIKEIMPTLKIYSTSFPSTVATSDTGILCYNQSFQSQYGQFVHNLSNGASPEFGSTSKFLPGIANKLVYLDEELNMRNENSDVTRMDGSDMVVPSPKEETKPCVLNLGARHCLQASTPSKVSFCGPEHPEQTSGIDDVIRLQQSGKPQSLRSIFKNPHHRSLATKKRVRFAEPECDIQKNKNVLELKSSGRTCSTKVTSKRQKYSNKSSGDQTREESFDRCFSNADKGHMLQGMHFLLTGLPRQRGKDIIIIIQKHGGIILPDIPSPLSSMGSRNMNSNWHQLPIILSTKKHQTAKFLYGCAVNTLILHIDWLTNSLKAGSILPYDRYLILPWQAENRSNIMNQVNGTNGSGIFEKVGVMLYGKNSFCTKLEKTVKHGKGQVLKTVRRLVQRLEKEKISMGAIVTEDDNMASRHLRQCASEWNIPVMSSSWIIQSLHSGKLLPLTE